MTYSRMQRLAWWSALIITGWLTFHPAATLVTRAASLGFVALLLASMLLILPKRARLIFAGLCLVLIVVVLVPWTIRTPAQELNAAFVGKLKQYDHCPYYWGGESKRGIDCSGLIRRGMIDACLSKGWSDPGLWHHAFNLWLHDTSARALGEEYRGLTRSMFDTANLNTLDHACLQAGDLAVTQDGQHIMAYLGQQTWIEADPLVMKVIQEHAPSKTNGWFLVPMKIVRWSLLEERASTP